MNGTFFDTLSVAENLQDAGIERKHAEAIAKAVKAGQGDLATKSDIDQVRAEISQVRAEISQVRTEMNSDIQRLEDKINNLRWTVIVVAGLVVALVKLIP